MSSTKIPGSFRRASLAVGISSSLLSPLAAAEGVASLEKLQVEERSIDTNPYAEPGAPYKAKFSGDERLKRPIAETAQNISVLTKAQIEDSGYTDLREILDAQPGITLGTGENGNAFGDRYVIRGQEARSDVFVDGLRDPGMTIRESFATEQVEISKGPNSSFAGRGTAGGAVNSVTKQASAEHDFTKVSAAVGTDKHHRLTLDTNQVVNDVLAIRANLLHGHEDVPDRGPTDRERKGVALSALVQPNADLEFVVDYYGMKAEDNPDIGGFLTGTLPNRVPARNVPVYAQSQDFLASDVDIFTARLKYKFSPQTRLTNVLRSGKAENGYVVTGARAATTDVSNPGGVYDTISLSTHQGWQDVDYLVNQTNLHWDAMLGGKKHEFILGLEFSDHKVLNGVYTVTNSGENCIVSGRGAPAPGFCATDAAGAPVNGLNNVMNRVIAKGNWDIDWQVKTVSASVMDTVDLSDRWTVFAGLRHDHFDFDTVTQSTTTLVQTPYAYSDGLWNGHIGASFKIRPDANVYFSYATASDINGGESDVGSSCGYGGICVDTANGVSIAQSKPETTQSLELGTKWNLMGGKLLATGALFQITKKDVMEQTPGGTGYTSTGSQNTGENRVRGVEFGLSGNLTDKLSAQAGLTVMSAEVLKSNVAANVGKTLSNFADKTASLQLRYQLTPALALGGAMKYEDKKYAGQPDSAAGLDATTGAYSQPIPAYTVFDVFANYRFDKKTDLRLNIGNVTDKEYYLAGYRSGSFLYYGDARNVRLTLNHEF